MLVDAIAVGIVVLAAGAFVHHHFVYPFMLRRIASARRAGGGVEARRDEWPVPTVTIIVPAYNEERHIAEKIRNLAALDYPHDRLKVVIALDGCTDATEKQARGALAAVSDPNFFQLVVNAVNRGKVAVLNEEIARVRSDIVALSDASALLDPDALMKATRHFSQPDVGVVCPTYRLSAPRSAGEGAYWAYQTRIKADEALVAAPMGAHGAFYLFRRAAWTPLRPATINDDFVLPMTIVAHGYRAIYDESVVAREGEQTKSNQEFWRRVRIGAGNMQQLLWLGRLGHPRNGWLSFVFLSGKGLRPLVPMLAATALGAMAFLTVRGYVLFELGLIAALAALALALAGIVLPAGKVPRLISWLAYLVEGHAASLYGACKYMTSSRGVAWSQAAGAGDEERDYTPWSVRTGKRVLDLICVAITLAFLALFFVPIALAIKLDSRGPIFYRQLRVGYCRPNVTTLFYVIKFRTMREDAETLSGAVWATKDDPRVTRVGRFLRKTRIDELPQVFNVIAGEMSFVGPRPERPKLVSNLEEKIPFYLERNFYMLPGITGLAQINQGYDDTIDDVRRKVLFDHAYAARLSSFWSWLKADLEILFGTLRVMILGRGR